MGLENNKLVGSVPSAACSINVSNLTIWADCGGTAPVKCTCCTVCCPSAQCTTKFWRLVPSTLHLFELSYYHVVWLVEVFASAVAWKIKLAFKLVWVQNEPRWIDFFRTLNLGRNISLEFAKDTVNRQPTISNQHWTLEKGIKNDGASKWAEGLVKEVLAWDWPSSSKKIAATLQSVSIRKRARCTVKFESHLGQTLLDSTISINQRVDLS